MKRGNKRHRCLHKAIQAIVTISSGPTRALEHKNLLIVKQKMLHEFSHCICNDWAIVSQLRFFLVAIQHKPCEANLKSRMLTQLHMSVTNATHKTSQINLQQLHFYSQLAPTVPHCNQEFFPPCKNNKQNASEMPNFQSNKLPNYNCSITCNNIFSTLLTGTCFNLQK